MHLSWLSKGVVVQGFICNEFLHCLCMISMLNLVVEMCPRFVELLRFPKNEGFIFRGLNNLQQCFLIVL